MNGNAFKDKGSPHFEFYKSLEKFWDDYRPGGTKRGETPTCEEYDNALRKALKQSGYGDDEVESLAKAAAENRARFGLDPDDPVPRIPWSH